MGQEHSLNLASSIDGRGHGSGWLPLLVVRHMVSQGKVYALDGIL